MSRLAVGRAGAVLLFLSVPVAAWWRIGDLSEPYGDSYLVPPLYLRFGGERVFGILAIVVGLVGLVLLVRSLFALRWARTSWALAVVAVLVAEILSVSSTEWRRSPLMGRTPVPGSCSGS